MDEGFYNGCYLGEYANHISSPEEIERCFKESAKVTEVSLDRDGLFIGLKICDMRMRPTGWNGGVSFRNPDVIDSVLRDLGVVVDENLTGQLNGRPLVAISGKFPNDRVTIGFTLD